MLIDPNNRPRKPDSWAAGVHRTVIKYCQELDEVEDDFPHFWNALFEYWTEPFPIRQPKAYSAFNLMFLRLFIKDGNTEDWPDEWWSKLADSFMHPEYKKD